MDPAQACLSVFRLSYSYPERSEGGLHQYHLNRHVANYHLN